MIQDQLVTWVLSEMQDHPVRLEMPASLVSPEMQDLSEVPGLEEQLERMAILDQLVLLDNRDLKARMELLDQVAQLDHQATVVRMDRQEQSVGPVPQEWLVREEIQVHRVIQVPMVSRVREVTLAVLDRMVSLEQLDHKEIQEALDLLDKLETPELRDHRVNEDSLDNRE